MPPVTFYRASRLALLLGLPLVLIGFVFTAFDPGFTPAQEGSALFVASEVLKFSGVALLLFGWLGIVARLAALTGWLGLAGALLIFLSGVGLAGISAYNFLASPYYAVHAPTAAAAVALGTPAVGVISYVTGTLLVGGAVLVEMAMLRARLRAAWAGVLLILAAVVGLVFVVVNLNYIGITVAILLFVGGLGWMAYALLSTKGEAPQEGVGMPSATLSRASGLALLLGSLLVLIGIVLRALDPGVNTTQEASALFVVSNVLVFSGLALLLFGWLGIVARLAELSSWLGLAGALLIFLSGVVYAGIIAYNFLASPYYAVHAPNVAAQVVYGTPAVVVTSIVSTSLVFGGAVLAEMAMLRARLRAAWAGVLLVVAAVVGLVSVVVILNYIGIAVAILLFIGGLGWMAYTLLSAKGEAPRQPAPTP